MKQNDAPKGPKAICIDCYFDGDCKHKPKSNGRCDIYIKGKKVEMGDNISVSPMDTIQMSYDDLKDILEDIDRESKNKLSKKDT